MINNQNYFHNYNPSNQLISNKKEAIINVGIFWFYKSHLIAKRKPVNEIKPDDIGMIDSPFQHITEWESKKIYIPRFKELIASEYQELPRGRVIYSNVSNKVIIYMDKTLFSLKNKVKIIQYFNLGYKNILWKEDYHYKTY